MTRQLVLVERKTPAIATITLNDPEQRNAMSQAMAEEFAKVTQALRTDVALRVVILRGAGKAFSAGGHLEMLVEKMKLPTAENRRLMELFYAQFLSLRDIEVPVVAAINGVAIGAGCCLALACDLRIAVREAKLGLNFVHLGLHPGMGATYFLSRLVGPARASELLYTGRIFTAAEAEQYGLVNHAVPEEKFEAEVESVTAAICNAGPQAVRELKQSLSLSDTLPLAACLKREAHCQSLDYAGSEFAEGVSAAREKRKPQFGK